MYGIRARTDAELWSLREEAKRRGLTATHKAIKLELYARALGMRTAA